jgi:hypothetical protein
MARINSSLDNKDYELLSELMYHYSFSQDDMDKRKLRKNGWDETVLAYFGKLPSNWPYLARVVDPVIRTAILEKTARNFAGKLRGTVAPREGADALSAKIQNQVLDFQWDYATKGGSMIEKIILMDIQTRLFGASFGLVYWDVKPDGNGGVIETNEFKTLDNRDVFVDYQANHVKNANWVQVREWVTYQDLQAKDADGNYIYNDINKLKELLDKDQRPAPQRRDNRYTSMVKQLRSLEDRVGQDIYYPTIEVVTEYRRDRWITFAPRYGVILRNIENPYKNMEIPVVMLRYYPTGDDVYGESEVESVIPLYRAINSLLCGYLDQMNLAMRPPIKIANNSVGVRLDTIKYGPQALWLVGDSVGNVQEHISGSQSIQAFQTSYTALKAAFNIAMGESSQLLAQIGPFAQERTATEIRSAKQQTVARDNYNQIYLEEFLKDLMMKWISNNQQFMFADPTKEAEIIRIVGEQTISELEQMGMSDYEIPQEILNETANLIQEREGGLTDEEIEVITETAKMPKNPVVIGGEIKPKLERDGDSLFAKLYVTASDMKGLYDYIPDVKSMAVGTTDEQIRGRNQALNLLLNPSVDVKLQAEGVGVNIKDLLIQILEDNGVKNASKLFQEGKQGTLNAQPGQIDGRRTANIIPGTSALGTQGNESMGVSPELFGTNPQ